MTNPLEQAVAPCCKPDIILIHLMLKRVAALDHLLSSIFASIASGCPIPNTPAWKKCDLARASNTG